MKHAGRVRPTASSAIAGVNVALARNRYVRRPAFNVIRIGRVAREILLRGALHSAAEQGQTRNDRCCESEGCLVHKNLFCLLRLRDLRESRRGSRAACMPRRQRRELALKQGEPRKKYFRNESPRRRFCAPIVCHRVDTHRESSGLCVACMKMTNELVIGSGHARIRTTISNKPLPQMRSTTELCSRKK